MKEDEKGMKEEKNMIRIVFCKNNQRKKMKAYFLS